MKILITTDWYSPAVNGVVTSVLNLRRELELRGHEVRVLTLLAGPALLRAGRRDPDRVCGGGAGVSRRPAADGSGGPLGPGAGGVGTGRGPFPV